MKRSHMLLLALALLFLLGANLRVQYRVSVDGTRLPGSYSASVLREGRLAATEAAEEILRYEAKTPACEARVRLSFRRAENDVQALTEALLRRTSGVAEADAVLLNGTRLGTVADGEALCEALRETLRGAMPAAAASGNISGQIELRRVYTRADGTRPTRTCCASSRASPRRSISTGTENWFRSVASWGRKNGLPRQCCDTGSQ